MLSRSGFLVYNFTSRPHVSDLSCMTKLVENWEKKHEFNWNRGKFTVFIFFKLFKNGICFCCIPLADNRKRIFSLYVLSGHCACSMIFNIEYLFIALNVFKLLFKTKFTLIYLFLFANIGENSMLQIKYIFRLLSYFLFYFL